MRSDHKSPQDTHWNFGLWQTAKSVLGFFTVTVGGYWLLRTGGRLWSEPSEAGTLTLLDSTTGAPLPTDPFPITEPFSEWSVSSELTSTEFTKPTLFSDLDTEADDDAISTVDTGRIRSNPQRLLQATSSPSSYPQQGQFPEVLLLGSLNGQNGFKLDGENNDDYSGWFRQRRRGYQWRWIC